MTSESRAYVPTTTSHEWQTESGAGSESNLLVCQRCGSVVARESTDLHDKWHRGEFARATFGPGLFSA